MSSHLTQESGQVYERRLGLAGLWLARNKRVCSLEQTNECPCPKTSFMAVRPKSCPKAVPSFGTVWQSLKYDMTQDDVATLPNVLKIPCAVIN